MRKQHLNVMLAVPFAASVLGAGEAGAIPSECDAIAGNLVTNCGFENSTGGWSPGVTQIPLSSGLVHTGSFSEQIGDGIPTVQQTIPTVSNGCS
jgi:hypothetical protein